MYFCGRVGNSFGGGQKKILASWLAGGWGGMGRDFWRRGYSRGVIGEGPGGCRLGAVGVEGS